MPRFDLRADSASPEQLVDRLRGHVPEYLPDGFGLDSVWGEGDRTLGSAAWADARCRTVTVFLAVAVPDVLPRGPRVGDWVVTIDSPGCGNLVLGDGRCLRYLTRVDGAGLWVVMTGLERPVGDKIVRSIPCEQRRERLGRSP